MILVITQMSVLPRTPLVRVRHQHRHRRTGENTAICAMLEPRYHVVPPVAGRWDTEISLNGVLTVDADLRKVRVEQIKCVLQDLSCLL
jgi:hypothetical protein